MTQSEDNFIGRWSRRKREREKGVKPSQPADNDQELAAEATVEPDSPREVSDTEVAVTTPANGQVPAPVSPTDADMVALDTLDADSDYAPFMSEGVSGELRKAALKKLFFSGKFAARDGLDDYDDDFTNFEPLGDTVTSDMKFHARRKEKARLAKLEEERLALEAQSSDASENDGAVTAEMDSAAVEKDSTAAENETVGGNAPAVSEPAVSEPAVLEPAVLEHEEAVQVESEHVPQSDQGSDILQVPAKAAQHSSIADDQQQPQPDPDSGKTA